ncbi:hypothetical protein TUMSATVNIG3_48610 [Vibrio nigripulchritudo]|nr:hypothetical protein TUMSATVNIG2_47970 [Vibrio nigripulchritudo]BDU46063.1 hypothetical protein TUMSATVNIG3_48610 [Vibrio nigripulchritudo]
MTNEPTHSPSTKPPNAKPDAKRAEKVRTLFSFLLVLAHIKYLGGKHSFIFRARWCFYKQFMASDRNENR